MCCFILWVSSLSRLYVGGCTVQYKSLWGSTRFFDSVLIATRAKNPCSQRYIVNGKRAFQLPKSEWTNPLAGSKILKGKTFKKFFLCIFLWRSFWNLLDIFSDFINTHNEYILDLAMLLDINIFWNISVLLLPGVYLQKFRWENKKPVNFSTP